MPLLTTKLYFPPARSSLVSRPRLVERLQNGLTSRLMLVSAPAGYGKTTLMSEWRAGVGCDYSTAWLSLDNDDNDPTLFLTYIIAALATLKPGFGETALSWLQSSPPLSTQVILTSLINEMGEIDKPFALVLDDYHVITNHPIHEAVTYLLNHLPSQMHLVILTRADPPIPLSRMRARNQLIEIRAADLRFTVEEAATFLNQVMKVALSIDQVGALEQRTEGWVTGLQLAALSMQGRDDLQSFVSAFTGSHHYILDYLADEVLNSQSESVQEFLLRTSILDRLTAPLCDMLTDRTDSQLIMENLERANLFIIPMDDEQRWYRYHHLFAELLRKRLGQIYPNVIADLHRKAAVWHEQQRFIEKSIEHYFYIKDYDQIVHLLRQYYFQLMIPRNVTLLWHWFNLFPDDILRGNPWLSLYYAWLIWNRGDRIAVESYLDSAQQALDHRVSTDQLRKDDLEYRTLQAEILSFRGVISASKGESEHTIELANQTLALAPETAYTIRSIVYLNLYVIHRDRGELEKSIETCIQAVPIAKKGGEKGLIIDAYRNLAVIYTIQGRLKQAEKVYQEGLQYAEKEWELDYPSCGLLLIHLAEIYYEWDILDLSEHMAERALRLSEIADRWTMIYGRVVLARLHRAKHNFPQAEKLLEEAETLLKKFQGVYFESELRAYLARLQAEFGKVIEAEQWVHSVILENIGYFNYPQYVIAFQLAYTLLNLGRISDLLALLDQIEAACEAQDCLYWQVQALVIMAAVWQKNANPTQALVCLEKALSLAEPEGYVRVFLDAGEPLVELLQQAMKKDKHLDYVRKILSTENRSTLAQLLIEPLSERELQVIRLVADGFSNGQIADKLFIAPGTVKKHINNIFGKLGVQSRTQSVARARELKLL